MKAESVRTFGLPLVWELGRSIMNSPRVAEPRAGIAGFQLAASRVGSLTVGCGALAVGAFCWQSFS